MKLLKGGGTPTPETGWLSNYNPLWKNDLSNNWIINGPRQRDEELAEDVGLEKPSESEPSVPWGMLLKLLDQATDSVANEAAKNHCYAGNWRKRLPHTIVIHIIMD